MRLRYRLPLYGIAITPLIMAAGFWLFWLSPWTYDRPDSLPAIQEGPHRVFVYGTLRYAPVRWVVYGRTGEPRPASLQGYERHGLDLTVREDASVEGLLLTVDRRELQRLDRYERVGIRYARRSVRLDNGQEAWVYQRLPHK